MYQILLSRYEVFHKSHDALNLINPCFRKKNFNTLDCMISSQKHKNRTKQSYDLDCWVLTKQDSHIDIYY